MPGTMQSALGTFFQCQQFILEFCFDFVRAVHVDTKYLCPEASLWNSRFPCTEHAV